MRSISPRQSRPGIIGLALLRRFVVEFDHITPRLILHERASYRPPSDMTSVPLVFRSNPTVPYVDIDLSLSGGAPQMFRVVPDTGAAFYGAVFVGDAMTRVRSQLPNVPAITYSDSRITQLIAARPASISVGPFTMQKPVIALLERTVGGGGIADGVLGSGFLRSGIGLICSSERVSGSSSRFGSRHVCEPARIEAAPFILAECLHVVESCLACY